MPVCRFFFVHLRSAVDGNGVTANAVPATVYHHGVERRASASSPTAHASRHRGQARLLRFAMDTANASAANATVMNKTIFDSPENFVKSVL